MRSQNEPEIWHILEKHPLTGEVYCLQYKDDTIIGICGPIHYSEGALPVDERNFEIGKDVEWAKTVKWRITTPRKSY